MAPGSPTHRPSDLRDRFFVPSLSACCFLFLSCSPLASFTPLFFSFGSFSLPNSLSVPEKPLFFLFACRLRRQGEEGGEIGDTRVAVAATPNPGKGPRPLQSRLFQWYWPPAAAKREENWGTAPGPSQGVA